MCALLQRTFCGFVGISARRLYKLRQNHFASLYEVEKLLMTMSPLQDCAATIEALIFASDRPVREREMEAHLPDGVQLKR